ncbi:MAG: hypothetical protein QM786_00630 [Breznakibacter sp.]
MKPLKTTILAMAVAFFGAVGQLGAQEPVKKERSPEEIARQQTQRLTKELSLTDAQQKAVYDINLKHVQQKSELRKSLREAKKDLDKRDEELKTVFNDEQKQKFAELRNNQKAKFKQAATERRKANQPTE